MFDSEVMKLRFGTLTTLGTNGADGTDPRHSCYERCGWYGTSSMCCKRLYKTFIEYKKIVHIVHSL